MKGDLHDLRILKLAEMYEIAYERFVLDMAFHVVDDERVRTLIDRLAPEGDQHAHDIQQMIAKINARLGPEDRAQLEYAALLDILEVESAAFRFYSASADRVHDPAVSNLLRELAREERAHVALVEEALRVAQGGAYRISERTTGASAPPLAPLPLREGGTDLDRTRKGARGTRR